MASSNNKWFGLEMGLGATIYRIVTLYGAQCDFALPFGHIHCVVVAVVKMVKMSSSLSFNELIFAKPTKFMLLILFIVLAIMFDVVMRSHSYIHL